MREGSGEKVNRLIDIALENNNMRQRNKLFIERG
jgi:hypothetical protein